MKLSKQTYDVLRNFSSITADNNMYPLIFKEPKTIVVMSKYRDIIAVYDTEEEFPTNIGIQHLNKFLGAIALFNIEETELTFKDKFVSIKWGKNSIKYIFTHAELLPNYEYIKPSEKYKKFDTFDSHFYIKEEEINRIKKATSILFQDVESHLKKTKINISIDKGSGIIEIDSDDTILKDNFKLKIDDVEGKCSIAFDIQNLLLHKGDYKVSILNKKMIKFQHKELPLMYFITPKAT